MDLMAPYPLPRLALSAAVAADDRSRVTFTVTNAKSTTAYVEPGDRHGQRLTVAISGGTGTVAYTYPDAGHHTYTARATCALAQLYPTWTALAAANASWSAVPAAMDTWADGTATEETATTTVTVDVGDATIFAHVEAGSSGIPIVAVDVWIGLPAASVARWAITRLPESPVLPDYPIWLDTDHPSGASIEDHEAPLNVTVRYLLTLTRTDGTVETFTSNPVILDTITGCLLTAVDTGRTIKVTIQSWTETTRDARSVRLGVINRPDPVVISDGRLWERGTIVFRTLDQPSLIAFRELLDAPILLLRTQPASALETRYLAPGDHTESRLFPEDGTSWVRQHQIPYQRVAPPSPSARQNSATWAQFAAAFPTWAAVPAALPTWADVRTWRPQ